MFFKLFFFLFGSRIRSYTDGTLIQGDFEYTKPSDGGPLTYIHIITYIFKAIQIVLLFKRFNLLHR